MRRASSAALPRRAALLAPLALSACGSWFGESKKPLPGKRLDVLPPARTLAVAPGDTSAIVVPQPVRNAEWPQPGGNAQHQMGSLAAGTTLTEAWRASIGEGASYRRMLTASPIVAGGKVFTMDAAGIVSAFSLHDGTHLWRFNPKAPKDRSQEVGGGISTASGLVYAATGRAEVVAIDAQQGKLHWRHAIGEPARAAPGIAGGKLFVPTIAGSLVALSADKGQQIWLYQGSSSAVGVLGDASPAVADALVIAGFSTGDLIALAADSGAVQWSDGLGAAFGGQNPADVSAVRALPVVNQGVVYAISLGGLLVAADIHSGRRIFYLEVAGGQTPVVAGDWLFVLTADQHLAAIGRNDGLVRWITVMPLFTNPKHQRGPIVWRGPLLAGGRLLLAGDNGQLAAVAPENGKILGYQHLPGPAALPPIVADGTVLVLLRSGTLIAWR